MTALTLEMVERAIKRYAKGERPYPFVKPRSWYVIGKAGRLYPLKYIYAMAIGQTPSFLHTNDARREFDRLRVPTKQISTPDDLNFQAKVKASLSNPERREIRIPKAPRKPQMRLIEAVVFDRNPDIVAAVLANAKGVCGNCGSKAPFLRKKDGMPYLGSSS